MRVQITVLGALIALHSYGVNGATIRDGLDPVLEQGPWYYEVGGAQYVPLTRIDTTRVTAGAGIAWNGNLMCSNLNPTVSYDAFLNGAKDGFMKLQRNAVSAVSGVVASLPGLALQYADPGLYELVSTGFIRAEELFAIELANCRQITRDIATGQPNYDWVKVSGYEKLSNVFNSDGSPISSVNEDAGSLMDDTEENAGRDGVEWVCGTKAGGDDQPSILSSDIVVSSFNQLAGRDSCDLSNMSDAEKEAAPLYAEYWQSVDEMKHWFIEVVGETIVNTTPSKKPVEKKIGSGLMPKIEKEYDVVWEKLEALIIGSEIPTLTNLREVSFSDTLINRGLVEKLRRDPQGLVLGQRLALDIAMQREMMRALTMRRMLMSGQDIEVVAGSEPAKKLVDDSIDRLSKEIRLVREDIEIRRELMASTAPLVLQRAKQRESIIIREAENTTIDALGGSE